MPQGRDPLPDDVAVSFRDSDRCRGPGAFEVANQPQTGPPSTSRIAPVVYEEAAEAK